VHDVERAKELGLDFGEPHISLDPLRKWKAERVVGKLSRGLAGVAKRRAFKSSAARRVRGFTEPSHRGDEPQVIRFAHAVIATGSIPARLPGFPMSERVMDSTAALELSEIPGGSSSSAVATSGSSSARSTRRWVAR